MISPKAATDFNNWRSRGEHQRPHVGTRDVATAYAMYSFDKQQMIHCRINGVDYSDLNGNTSCSRC